MARELNLREDGFTIEHELVIRALLRGYRVGDAPAHECTRQHGQSHINIVRIAPYFVAHLLYLLAHPKVRGG